MSKEGKTIHTEMEKQRFGKHMLGGLSRGNRTVSSDLQALVGFPHHI